MCWSFHSLLISLLSQTESRKTGNKSVALVGLFLYSREKPQSWCRCFPETAWSTAGTAGPWSWCGGCSMPAGEGCNHPCDGHHHFIALWQYCLSTEFAKWSIFLVLWGVWSAAPAVWEGNCSWQHWDCCRKASPWAQGGPDLGLHCASRYAQVHQWFRLPFSHFHVDHNPRKKGPVGPWGQQKSYYVLDTFWPLLKPCASCPCRCWKFKPRRPGLKHIGSQTCEWRQAPKLFPLVILENFFLRSKGFCSIFQLKQNHIILSKAQWQVNLL